MGKKYTVYVESQPNILTCIQAAHIQISLKYKNPSAKIHAEKESTNESDLRISSRRIIIDVLCLSYDYENPNTIRQ